MRNAATRNAHELEEEMTTLHEAAMRLALEALEYHTEQTRPIHKTNAAIEALKAALAQQGEQPVAWVDMENGVPVERPRLWQDHTHGEVALYAAAPAAHPDADPNAPWMTEAHCLCTDHGIPQGNLTERIRALRDKLAQQGEPETWIDDGGWEFPIERHHGIGVQK